MKFGQQSIAPGFEGVTHAPLISQDKSGKGYALNSAHLLGLYSDILLPERLALNRSVEPLGKYIDIMAFAKANNKINLVIVNRNPSADIPLNLRIPVGAEARMVNLSKTKVRKLSRTMLNAPRHPTKQTTAVSRFAPQMLAANASKQLNRSDVFHQTHQARGLKQIFELNILTERQSILIVELDLIKN